MYTSQSWTVTQLKSYELKYAVYMKKRPFYLLMRKVYDLRMKDNDSVASHLNDFDALWSHLQA